MELGIKQSQLLNGMTYAAKAGIVQPEKASMKDKRADSGFKTNPKITSLVPDIPAWAERR